MVLPDIKAPEVAAAVWLKEIPPTATDVPVLVCWAAEAKLKMVFPVTIAPVEEVEIRYMPMVWHTLPLVPFPSSTTVLVPLFVRFAMVLLLIFKTAAEDGTLIPLTHCARVAVALV